MEIVIKIDRLDEILEALKQLGGGCNCHSKPPVEDEKPVPTSSITPPTPVTPSVTPTALPQAVPTKAPSYTLDQLSKAAVGLIETPGGLQQLNGLLDDFGVRFLNGLDERHYGAFAMALRNLGVQI